MHHVQDTASDGQLRRVVLVTGMHRSGTSLIANMLRAAGVPLGGPLLDTPRPDAPIGYGEHAEIVEIQEQLLGLLGRAWYGPDRAVPLPVDWLIWPETRLARARIGAVVARETQTHGLWAVKDPRTSRLLALWLELLEKQGIVADVLLCLRHPRAVAASLAQREGLDSATAIASWTTHVTEIMRALGGRTPLIAEYEAALADPIRVLRALDDALAIGMAEGSIAQAAALAQERHRHHRPDTTVLPGTDGLAAAEHLYARLAAQGVGAPPGSHAEFGPLLVEDAVSAHGSVRSVGIVMRTRERIPFLPRALRSVLGQTHRRWHLHVVNDGGAPAPVEAAIAPYRDAFGDRITVTHLPAHAGMEAASNHALGRAREDMIAIHDDDDSWRPRFLETSLAEAERSGARGVVTGTTVVHERLDGSTIVSTGASTLYPELTGIHYAELLAGNRFPPIAFIYERAVLAEIGDYRADLPVLGDWEFNLRFAARTPIAFLPETLACWHQRPADDAYPNTTLAKHARVGAALRDEILRAAGPGAAATIAAMTPLVDASVRVALAEHQHSLREGASTLAAGIATLMEEGWNGDARRTLRLAPERWGAVVRDGDVWVSLSDDPNVIFTPPPPGLMPGRWRVSVELEVIAGTFFVQAFFSATEDFREEQSVVLAPDGPRSYGGVLEIGETVRCIRLDPMAAPGRFRLGLMTVRGPRLRESASGGRFPDFLCIGAQRSGTTWLHRNLAAHPGVWLPPGKEIHFFDSLFDIDVAAWARYRLDFLRHWQERVLAADAEGPQAESAWRMLEWAGKFATRQRVTSEWYAEMFADAPARAITGDITPGYAVLPDAAVAYATRLLPDVKILFLLRDPVERSLSGALHELTTAAGRREAPTAAGRRNAPTAEALWQALDDPRCRTRSDYRATIERWERHVGPERIGYVFFDEIRTAPHAALRRVCAWLGIGFDERYFPRAAQPENANPVPATLASPELLHHLATRHRDEIDWLADRFGGPALGWARAARERLRLAAPVPAVPTATPWRPRHQVELALAAVVVRHGPWLSHNIEVAQGVFTIGPEPTGNTLRLARFLALTDALAGSAMDGLRVLDLGCGEGLYALEYARRGAAAVGVEIRAANLAKARFAQWALGLPGVEFRQEDVRTVSRATHGTFDIIICSGILYHLDSPDVFEHVEAIAAMTGRVAIFDTRIAIEATAEREWRGEVYAGTTYREHAPDASTAEREAALLSSYRQDESFWLTHEALVRLLQRCGFATVLEIHAPAHLTPRPDRITLAALPGPAAPPVDGPPRRMRQPASANAGTVAPPQAQAENEAINPYLLSRLGRLETTMTAGSFVRHDPTNGREPVAVTRGNLERLGALSEPGTLLVRVGDSLHLAGWMLGPEEMTATVVGTTFLTLLPAEGGPMFSVNAGAPQSRLDVVAALADAEAADAAIIRECGFDAVTLTADVPCGEYAVAVDRVRGEVLYRMVTGRVIQIVARGGGTAPA